MRCAAQLSGLKRSRFDEGEGVRAAAGSAELVRSLCTKLSFEEDASPLALKAARQGSRSPSPEGMDCEAHVWAVGGRPAAAQAHGAAGGGGGHLDPFQEPADCYVGGGGSRLARLEELGGSAPLSKLRRASLGASDQPGGLLARRAALLCAAAAAAGDGSGAAAESPDHLRRKALLNSTAHLRQGSPSSSSSSPPPSPPSGWRKYPRRRSAPSVMSTGTLITAAAEVMDCAAAVAAWAAGYRPTPRSVRSSSLSAEDVDAMCV